MNSFLSKEFVMQAFAQLAITVAFFMDKVSVELFVGALIGNGAVYGVNRTVQKIKGV